ncbi:MAG: exopolyphosphatase [Candidatus Eremiobacteraeota bacterium]|nr:exopolyphosphatase [Candidatus Eremiobacteraeota bacterium]
MIRGLISIGTNTTRLLVAKMEPDGSVQQLEQRQTGTRLGEGLREGGLLAPAAIERTIAAVTEFTAVAREYGAALASIATSAVRRASDGAAFGSRMRDVTGVPLEVIPGRDEAEASFRGATYGVPHDGLRVAVVDVGGGSTECAVGCDGRLDDARSIEIGSVRVAERYPALTGGSPGARAHAAAALARADIAEVLAPFAALGLPAQVRCVAGTPLTIGAIHLRSHVDAVSGTTLSRADLDAAIARLLDATRVERRAMPGMLPQRADILAAGALVLSESLRLLGADAAVLESNDLLLGYLLLAQERAEAE